MSDFKPKNNVLTNKETELKDSKKEITDEELSENSERGENDQDENSQDEINQELSKGSNKKNTVTLFILFL